MFGQSITGNLADDVKKGLASVIGIHVRGFGDHVGKRIRILSADIQEKEEDATKLEVKVVCEIDVEKGKPMCMYCFRI